MRTLYVECKMGAAGDMLMGALYDLLPEEKQEAFLTQMHALGLSGIRLWAEDQKTCGITGTRMHVEIYGGEEEVQHHHHQETVHSHEAEHHHHGIEHSHEEGHCHHHGVEPSHGEGHHHHAHNSYQEILRKIRHLPLPEAVKTDIAAVYRLIGEAESRVHQSDLEHIHFHEVGSLDALADVTGCCMLIHMLEAERILVSPVCVGNGTVSCAHGILPVAAPATAELLKGVPFYTSSFDGELLTPTGAAILKHFADGFGSCPNMVTTAIGYGLGSKTFAQANCVRIFLGEVADTIVEAQIEDTVYTDKVTEICCNLDDMTPEELGFVCEELFAIGALDVYTIPIGMKKGRSGWMLCVLCIPKDAREIQQYLLAKTSTQGIRFCTWQRKKLKSDFAEVETPYGPISMKRYTGFGICKEKPEYEDVARAARKAGVSFQTVAKAAKDGMRDQKKQ